MFHSNKRHCNQVQMHYPVSKAVFVQQTAEASNSVRESKILVRNLFYLCIRYLKINDSSYEPSSLKEQHSMTQSNLSDLFSTWLESAKKPGRVSGV